jgi:hypothetical protein
MLNWRSRGKRLGPTRPERLEAGYHSLVIVIPTVIVENVVDNCVKTQLDPRRC